VTNVRRIDPARVADEGKQGRFVCGFVPSAGGLFTHGCSATYAK
jgi:hypothetical protein